ncbi:MAG: glucosaminidase domain-containing protein [Bacteroidota bacterium]
MRVVVVIIALLGFSSSLVAQAVAQNQDHLRYIERFSPIAMEEMMRAGIPASIKLAQGIHESGAGKSVLATRANNHFGIKCGSNWNGREVYREDDDFDANGRLIKSCFRGYRNADASYVAHSEFLRDPSKMRYNFLFRLDPMDYVAWAEGLRRAGYATDPAYPQKLVRIIERYELYKFDQQVMGQSIFDDPIVGPGTDIGGTPPYGNNDPSTIGGIGKFNDVTYFITGEAITVDELARRVDLSVRRILSYNEQLTGGGQNVNPGARVYLQPKRNSYRGRDRYHTVLPGESLFDISQRYAVKMDKLLRRNRLEEGQEPAAGERIKLRGGRVSANDRPTLRGNEPAPTPEPDRPTIITDGNGQIDMDDSGIDNPATGNPSSPSPGTVPPTPPAPSPQPPVVSPSPPPPPAPTNPSPVNTGNEEEDATVEPSPPTSVPTAEFHSVIRGETLYAISRRYGTTVDELLRLNSLSSNTIQIGQRLRVR